MILPRALVRRSPGYLPAVVQLDAVFDPGGLALCSSLSHSPGGLRPFEKDRHAPNIRYSRGYVSDSGLLSLHLAALACLPFRLAPSVITLPGG